MPVSAALVPNCDIETLDESASVPADIASSGWFVGCSGQMLARTPAPLDKASVAIASHAEIAQISFWRSAFAGNRKSSFYYELVEQTLRTDFDHRYIVIRDIDGAVRGIQPCFVVDQDIVAGLSAKAIAVVSVIRRYWPRFLKMRTLMVGCVAGEGHLNTEHSLAHAEQSRLLSDTLIDEARKLGAALVVWKEFPASYRSAMSPLLARGFTHVPSLPMTRLKLDHPDFESYLKQALSKATRKNLRRKFKAAAQSSPIEMTVMNDVSGIIEELYPLYLQVFERSDRHFEKLTKHYLCELGRRMPETVRFFVWRQESRAVAFSLCMLEGDRIYDEYLGLDYSVALKLHLYHYSFRDIFNWSVQHGFRWYYSSALNYDPKLHLRCELVPLDLYVRHTSDIANRIMAAALRWLDPTRADETLRQFPNFAELHRQR